MPSSPEEISPTEAAAREHRENSANGFTAVNGRGTPPQAVNNAANMPLVNGDGRPRSQHDRTSTGEPPRRPENGDSHGSISPLNSSAKRKRSDTPESDGEEGYESDTPEANGEQMDYSHDLDGDSTYTRQHEENSPEMQLVQALQREAGPNGYSRTPPRGPVNGITSTEDFVTTKAGVQVNPGKRKRAFANRTKTGCQTCRRRKKKCDENKPECNNCTRGGFKCEGYTQAKTFPKAPAAKQAPMPIQAKDGYGDTGGLYPRPRMDQVSRLNPFAATSIDQLQRQFSSEEELRDTTRNWTTPPYPTSGPRSYPAARHSADHSGISGLNGLQPRFDRSGPRLLPSGSRADMASSLQQYNSPAMLQRQASEALHYPRNSNKTERQKMLDGDEYSLYDPQLAEDREKCTKTVAIFNGVDEVGHGERERRLRLIFEPESRPVPAMAKQKSRLGNSVIIDTPFICSYGYNVTIADDVIIKRGCLISDARDVRIGKGTYIGEDVKILTETLPYPASLRCSKQTRAKGVAVHIGEGVYIGAGCIIHPDYDHKDGILSIGSYSYILPGTVVRKDVGTDVVFGVKDRDGPEAIRSVTSMCRNHGPHIPPREPYQYPGPTDPTRV